MNNNREKRGSPTWCVWFSNQETYRRMNAVGSVHTASSIAIADHLEGAVRSEEDRWAACWWIEYLLRLNATCPCSTWIMLIYVYSPWTRVRNWPFVTLDNRDSLFLSLPESIHSLLSLSLCLYLGQSNTMLLCVQVFGQTELGQCDPHRADRYMHSFSLSLSLIISVCIRDRPLTLCISRASRSLSSSCSPNEKKRIIERMTDKMCSHGLLHWARAWKRERAKAKVNWTARVVMFKLFLSVMTDRRMVASISVYTLSLST